MLKKLDFLSSYPHITLPENTVNKWLYFYTIKLYLKKPHSNILR